MIRATITPEIFTGVHIVLPSGFPSDIVLYILLEFYPVLPLKITLRISPRIFQMINKFLLRNSSGIPLETFLKNLNLIFYFLQKFIFYFFKNVINEFLLEFSSEILNDCFVFAFNKGFSKKLTQLFIQDVL